MRKLNPKYVEIVSALNNDCPYYALLSMAVRDVRLGWACLEIELQEKHLHPFGAVHGGVYASLIDSAVYWAVFSEIDEDLSMTSVDLKVNYLAPTQAGKLVAEGRRIKLGKTLALGEATVTNQEGKMLAHGTSTLMILGTPEREFDVELPPKFIEEA
jgi:uncharacterized protein (TIGR00369 family)